MYEEMVNALQTELEITKRDVTQLKITMNGLKNLAQRKIEEIGSLKDENTQLKQQVEILLSHNKKLKKKIRNHRTQYHFVLRELADKIRRCDYVSARSDALCILERSPKTPRKANYG